MMHLDGRISGWVHIQTSGSSSNSSSCSGSNTSSSSGSTGTGSSSSASSSGRGGSGSGRLAHQTTSTSDTTMSKPQSATMSNTKTLAQVMRRQPSSPHVSPAAVI